MTMSIEERVLCICARQAMDARLAEEMRELCQSESIDWPHLFELADSHLIAPLVYMNLQRSAKQFGIRIPDEIVRDFKASAIENTISEQQRRVKLLHALDYFAAQAIDVMLVKGIALDELVYNERWYTAPEDVDLLLRPCRSAFSQEQRSVIASFEEFGIECDGFAHHDVTMNDILPVDFERVWKDARQIAFEGRAVFVMSPEDMLIALCINSCRKRYFRLKALCDIAETVRTFSSLDWPLFVEKARTYDVTAIVYTALLVVKGLIGVDIPPHLLDNLALHSPRKALINRLCHSIPLTESIELRSDVGTQLFQRRLSSGVALRYATLQPAQLLRHLHFVLRTPNADFEFWDGE